LSASFCPFCALKHQSDSDGNELHHSALYSFSCNAVVSRLDEGRERADTKSCTEPSVDSEVILGFCASFVGLGVIETASDDYVRLCARAGKREYQIAERSHHSKVRRAGATDRSSGVEKVVVDPVEAHSDWELCHSYCQRNDAVVTRALNPTQFSYRNRDTAAYSQSVGLLGQGGTGEEQGKQESNRQCSNELLHDWLAHFGSASWLWRARNITSYGSAAT
jgi:hypothetical protein